MTAVPHSSRAEQTVACAAVFALGLRLDVHSGITAGSALAFVLAVVWVPVLRWYRGAVSLMVVGLATAVVGIALPHFATLSRAVDPKIRLGATALLLGVLAGIGVVLWARTVVSVPVIGLVYGGGALINAVVLSPSGSNPWKNNYAVPTAIVVLAFVMWVSARRHRSGSVIAVVALLALTATSGLNDSRSYAAAFVTSALLTLWQCRPTTLSRRASSLLTVLMFIALAGSSYWLGSKLLVAGYLGANAQARTIAQIDQSGSLILGGRPELEATLALMRADPAGFGVGVEPTGNDIEVAKTGLTSINYNPNNGYVERYMFGGHIELHSIFGDLWANWGPLALVLLVMFGFHTLRALATGFRGHQVNPLLVFLCVWTMWNFLFSPLYSSVPTLVLALGLAMHRTDRVATDIGSPSVPAAVPGRASTAAPRPVRVSA